MALLSVLACPICRAPLGVSEIRDRDGEEIMEGHLMCEACAARYPVRRGIPRFVPAENYASSFGYQWKRFRTLQLDSQNGTTLSARRLFGETGWSPASMRGTWVLDAGCGAGRFLEIAAGTDCQVVGLDLSDAIDAAWETVRGRPNAHLVQASLDALPFKRACFDACYCLGVVQHTRDPKAVVHALIASLKPSGRLALTIYERKPWTRCSPKYLLRPLTRRLDVARLERWVRRAMPVLFWITEGLYRIPWIGRIARFVLPVPNYVEETQLTRAQRYQLAILDTVDMLAPRYDQPQREADVRQWLAREGMQEIRRLRPGSLNLAAVKRAEVRVGEGASVS